MMKKLIKAALFVLGIALLGLLTAVMWRVVSQEAIMPDYTVLTDKAKQPELPEIELPELEEPIEVLPAELFAGEGLQGNTAANLVGVGYAAKLDHDIYFGDGEGIKRMDSDTGEIKMIHSYAEGTYPFSTLFINAFEDWIYFFKPYEGIFRIKPDGDELQKLVESDTVNDILYMAVYKDHIIYCPYTAVDGDLDSAIYKCSLDGTNQKKLADGYLSNDVNIIGDYIYRHKMSDGALERISIASGESENLGKKIYTVSNIVGNVIYYADSTGGLCSYDLESGIQTAYIGYAGQLTVWGDWIAYIDVSGNLCKIKTDGTNDTVIDAGRYCDISLVGDWVFYRHSAEAVLCCIRLDGTDKKTF